MEASEYIDPRAFFESLDFEILKLAVTPIYFYSISQRKFMGIPIKNYWTQKNAYNPDGSDAYFKRQLLSDPLNFDFKVISAIRDDPDGWHIAAGEWL